MRKTLLFLLLLSAKLAFGQFRDDFTDGNFTINPVWIGQASMFTINGDRQLKSSLGTVAQAISLATSSALALNVKWEFSVQLDFDPSTTNFTRIYLVSDQADLKGKLNGYFIQIGESGSTDSYDLYKQTGNSVTKIINGLPKNRTNINFLSTKLRVTRDEFGKWEVYTSLDDGATFSLEGSVIDKTFTNTSWFGVFCKYTATRSDGFVFDDFIVEELVTDVTPPRLIGVKVVDKLTMEATFSEAVSPISALLTSNYRLRGGNETPTTISLTSQPNVVKLSFLKPFVSDIYTLIVNGISDIKGNITLEGEATTFYVEAYTPQKGDVIINEVFTDPSPSVGLPSAEFVELWNTSNKYILLKDWKYKDLTTTYTFLTDTLHPNEYVILCATADIDSYKTFGKTIGLSVWPSLNNDKDRLSLIDSENVTIDEIFYTDNWYKDGLKKQGGYSLELIDPNNKCTGIQNWQASKHINGGTPGAENTVYQIQTSTTPPRLLSASIVDETTIQINFSKSIDSVSGALISNYKLNNGIGVPLTAVPQSPDFMSVLLKFSAQITKGQEYMILVNGISDCAGNLIDPRANTAKLFISKDIGKSDILISEILVNPKSGGVDFIEIYNATNDVLDLAALKLANSDEQGNLANIKSISGSSVYIPSKTFWVLTSDFGVVMEQYEVKNPAHFTKMTLPSFTNEKGTVALLSSQGEVDRFNYHEKMHIPLLQIAKGVSLERVSFQRPSNEKNNFKSAAQASGFATPTYKNSQQENNEIQNNFWLSTKVFSPDGDGVEDVLNINYQLIDQQYVANVSIFNDKGILIKRLIKNSTIPKMGTLSWDGLNEKGTLSKIGIYSIKFEAFALNGKMKNYEQAFVLASKL
ncbi:lamin tail domain-containing protein [Pedobacter sp. Du54]|uniref:lamin tail domain-containing protein n=1 Tax=Pedobacter anseongensis TaxID=3133439 RepID=UPI0030A7061A